MAIATKEQLRKEFLVRRDAVAPLERARHSSLIRQRIFQHPAWRDALVILCYVSFGSEAETHTIIQEAIRFKKRVVIPIHDPASQETPLSELQRFSELGANHRGVLQIKPEFARPVEPHKIELALVPGIVFDRQGGRVGFGGGYFDRLLPKMPKAHRLGLGYAMQISAVPLPLESFDVRLHAIVTEKEIIHTK